jgi:hypothetical protein
MSNKTDLTKPTIAEMKPYTKPILVKGPVLGSVTALSKNISGFQQPTAD